MSVDRAIRGLIFAYAERLDRGDLAGVGALFAHAGYGAGEGPLIPGDRLEAVLREFVILYEDGTPRTQHVTTNVDIEVDRDESTARARSYFTVLQGTEEVPLQTIVAGRYRDRFECVGSRWRFAERRVFTDFVGNTRGHLKRPPR